MSGPLLLAIDQGTQSTRALLFDPTGALIAEGRAPLPAYAAPRPGWAEQRAEVFWDAVRAACQGLWGAPGADRDRLAGVALACQRGTVLCLDEDGAPLRPAVAWPDERRASRLPKLPPLLRVASALPPVGRLLRDAQQQAECNWLQEHEPELWRRCARFGLLSAYLLLRLCGRYVDSVASQVGYLPFDFRSQRWAAPGHWLWRALAVRPEQLPALLPPGARLGAITAEAAAATGIPAGLPLFSAGADKCCEVLGAGALSPEVASLSYGTAATLGLCAPRYREAAPLRPAYPAAVPGAFCLEHIVPRGYWMVAWFRREFGHPEVAAAAERGVAPEALFERLLEETPPGAEGLLLQPHWSPPFTGAGPEARGALVGFTPHHGRAHVYRALIEGIAYALREGLARIEDPGAEVRALRVTGGGARSDGALQITADIFGLPVERPAVLEASALGAAINAAVGLGLYADHQAAAARMTRVARRFSPRPAERARYQALYQEGYLRLYGRLAPLYRALRRLTGYPP